jgi:hypothetical protein
MQLRMTPLGGHWQEVPENYSAIDTGLMGDCVCAIAIDGNGSRMFGYHGLGGFEAIAWDELPTLVEDLKTTRVVIVKTNQNPAPVLKGKLRDLTESKNYDAVPELRYVQFDIYDSYQAIVDRAGVVTWSKNGKPVEQKTSFVPSGAQ